MPPPPTNEGAPAWDGRPMGVEPALARKNRLKAETPKGRAPSRCKYKITREGCVSAGRISFRPSFEAG